MKKDPKNITKITNKYKKLALVLALDIAFCIGSYFLSRALLFKTADMTEIFSQYEFAIASMFVVLTISMLIFFDCYNAVWKYAGRVEFFKVVLAYIASFAMITILGLIMNRAFHVSVPSPLILMYLFFSVICSAGVRFFYAIKNYILHIRTWVDDKTMARSLRTVIIGAGYTGTTVIGRSINNPSDGYFPVALIDDDEEKHFKKIHGVMVEGSLDVLGETIARTKAQAIIIAIVSINKSELKHIYEECAKYNLPIKVISAMSDAGNISNTILSLRDINIEELLGREEFKLNRDLIDSSIKDKVVMVTGGAGSIGSELCRQALNFECKHLVIFDNHENGMFALNEEFKNIYDLDKYSLCMGSVRERAKLREVMNKFKPDIVFHAAAYKHVPMMEISATEAIKNNVMGTLNVIRQAEESGVERFIVISTDKAVNPANIMGASKRIAEMVIQDIGKTSKMNMAAVRFGNVLGSNGSVIPIFLKQIKANGPITLTDKEIKRYFMTIPEAVRLVMQAGALAKKGDVFVLDMGEPVYIYDLACDLIRINGLVPEKDIEIKITGLRPGEKLFEELRYDHETADKTIHEGIFVTKLEEIDAKKFEKQLKDLQKYATEEENDKTTDTIFTIVPSAYRNMQRDQQINTKEFESQGSQSRGDAV